MNLLQIPVMGGGVHANELLTCIPLHFVVGKESNRVFSTDLKPFFDFARQISKHGLKARNELEKDLFPFEDVTYPMDMSAEQKCFDLGGGCKVKEFFCVKCACRSSDAMFFWEGGLVIIAHMISVVMVDVIILKLMIKKS